ncbi:MAG: hypothetical protein ACYDBX_00515 [Patescibacteria group bacterium]
MNEIEPGFNQAEEKINEMRSVVSKWNRLKRHSAMGVMALAATVGIAGCAANNESVPTPIPTTTSVPKNTSTPKPKESATPTPETAIIMDTSLQLIQPGTNILPGEISVSTSPITTGGNESTVHMVFGPGTVGANFFNNNLQKGDHLELESLITGSGDTISAIGNGVIFALAIPPGSSDTWVELALGPLLPPPSVGVTVQIKDLTNSETLDVKVTG